MRERVFDIIERSDGEDRLSTIYDFAMMFFIVVSLIPLAFKADLRIFDVMDKTAAVVFILDYLLRWSTADYKLGKRSVWSFVRYPFTFMAIVDLVSILPSISVITRGFKLLRLLRMFRALRVMRIFKAFRYSRNFRIILGVLRRSKRSLIAVGTLAATYILIAALVIFNVEPDTYSNFFEAVYWATISLTTVGYGDIYPVSTLGRIFTMISAFLGIAIVAMPAGIITAGYMSEIRQADARQAEEDRKNSDI